MKNLSWILIVLAILVGVYFLFGENLNFLNITNEIGENTQKVYANERGEKWTLPEGDGVYNISNGPEVWPKFIKAEISPLQVYPGETQYMKVVLENDADIESVTAFIETDTETREVEMERVDSSQVTREDIENRPYLVDEDGMLVINDKSTSERIVDSLIDQLFNRAVAQETMQYTYEAEWVVEDTHETTYITEFVAVDVEDRENTHTMAWSDPWCGLRDYGSGNDSVSSNCTLYSSTGWNGIQGINGGNIILGSSNVTITDGATLAWGPGYSIDVSGTGSLTIQDGGVLEETYLYVIDEDGDGHAHQPSYKYTYDIIICPIGSDGDASVTNGIGTNCQVKCNPDVSQEYDCPGPDSFRRADVIPSGAGTDCNDNDGLVNPGQTSWFTSSGSNGWDYNCSGTAEERWTLISSCQQLDNSEGSKIAQLIDRIVSSLRPDARASFHTPTGWSGAAPSCGGSGIWHTGIDSCSNTEWRTQECH